jgi:hypothetical protein
MRDDQFPPHLQKLQRVNAQMPLRVSTAALLYIAAVRFMSALSERLAHFL